jgi:rSAM/selenodomain-associated transferase 1
VSGAIAILLKTPGLSPVKTRLAATLGQQTAEAFHLASAQSIAESVQLACQQDHMQGYYAVAEQAALQHDYWQDLPRLWQGEGSLGERMRHIYQTLLAQHDFVILVGADIPQMTATQLLDASAWLAHSAQTRLAFGPSDDGGFWLFGGNGAIAKNIWVDVVYSVADTGAQFIRQLKPVGDIKTLATLRDVDELADLSALYQSLLELRQALPAQQALLRLLHGLLSVSKH